jgi:hypothetical protein
MLFAGGSWENRSQYWENDVCNKCSWVNMIDPPPKAMLYCRLFWQTLRFQEMAKRRRVHPEPRLATSGHGRAIDNVSIVVREEKEKHRFIKEQWPKFGLTRSLRPS